MPIREALGIYPGNHIPAPVFLPNGFPTKKPIRSVGHTAFLPIQKLAARTAAPTTPKPDPIFLFYCGLDWHKRAETGAGWELVQGMRSQDKGIRALAAELLAGTENGRLLVRDLRRVRSGLNQFARDNEESRQDQGPEKGEDMHTPYGLQMVENCTTCTLRKDGFFCQLSGDLLRSFESFSHITTYPGGAVLFVEGQMPRGAFVLCSGKVKISTTSKEGKVLILRTAEPGDVIGLSAVISGQTYEIAAETLGPCLVNFVERDGLLRLIEPAYRAEWRTGTPFRSGREPRIPGRIPRNSRTGADPVFFRKTRSTPPLRGRRSRRRSKRGAHTDPSYSRGNGAKNWRIPRNCYAPAE